MLILLSQFSPSALGRDDSLPNSVSCPVNIHENTSLILEEQHIFLGEKKAFFPNMCLTAENRNLPN